ncbi:TetR family transcriptional regulator C-terminal domain-containing protein [Streptomyces sp. NPDC008086]|uniref:TetR family transcriptional regulator C-terminal domain-containing protein n=1 Tax=Streptomyces sp. NPDC008086 TaxID=3364807 RepID=UPI0036E790B0
MTKPLRPPCERWLPYAEGAHARQRASGRTSAIAGPSGFGSGRPPGRPARLAGVTVGSKEKLLLFGLEHLTGKFGERLAARVRAAGDAPGPRAMVEALLMTALPTDEESRVFHHLYTSYAVLAVTDRTLAAQPFIKDPDAAEAALTDLLRRAQVADLLQPGVDAQSTAVGLLAMSAGLGTSILVGQRSPESAATVLDDHLDRVFRPVDAAGGRGTHSRSSLPSAP